MSDATLDTKRAQMGASTRGWVVDGRQFTESACSWFFLSGVQSPNLNIALLYGYSKEEAASLTRRFDEAAVPALVFVAGNEAKDSMDVAAPEWAAVLDMPFMELQLASADVSRDARVRRAGPADGEEVIAVLQDAFHLEREPAAVCVTPSLPEDAPVQAWVLEDGGRIVSCVVTGRVGDASAVWCMATRSDARRKGYGKALLGDAMARAAADGAKYGLLAASADGHPLYEGAGWRTLEMWQVRAKAPPAEAGAEAAAEAGAAASE